MESSNQKIAEVNIKQMNADIIEEFKKRKAFREDSAITFQDIHVSCNDRLKLILVNEFVKSGFISIIEKKLYFNIENYEHEKKKTYRIYFAILLFPILVAVLMMIFKI